MRHAMPPSAMVAAEVAKARKLLEWGDLRGAVRGCREILAREADNQPARRLLGEALEGLGQLDEAIEQFRRALTHRPDDAELHNRLGTICARSGKFDEAAACFEEAIRLRPDYATAHHNWASALRDLGRLAEAEASYRTALRYEPDCAETHNSLGVLLGRQGQHAEALECFRTAIKCKPDFAAAAFNQAAALEELGQNEAAMGSLELAVRIRPDYAEAHHRLGRLLRQRGNLPRAAECFDAAARTKRDNTEAWRGLAEVLLAQNRLEDSIPAHREIVRLNPQHADDFNRLGIVLGKSGQRAEAIAVFERAIELEPDFAAARSNLGLALRDHGRPHEAIKHLEEAVRIKPDLIEAYNNLGNALRDLGRLDEAQGCYAEALRLKPTDRQAMNNLGVGYADQGKLCEAVEQFNRALAAREGADPATLHTNRALALLQMGDFEHGWPEYEWRWRCPAIRQRQFDQPRWDGSPLAGRTVLLYCEQGLGDTIQFIRYASLEKERGGTVVVECPRRLAPLLQSCPGIDQVVAEGDPLPPFECQSPLLSLPSVLRTRVDTVPARVPYLAADPSLVAQWKERLAALDGFRVAIAWQGNPSYRGDRWRSLPLAEFAPLAAIPGVSLVSLQKGIGAEQLATAHFPVIAPGDDLDEAAGAFMDTAAIMKNLDLVVTCDTSIAHLAGALAVPVWVALPLAADWRWLQDREDSPWYPTMRIFRQRESGDWRSVFQHMASELARDRAEHAASGGPSGIARLPVEQVAQAGEPGAAAVSADSGQAIRNAAAAATAPPDCAATAEAVAADARRHLKEGRLEQALAVYREAIRRMPGNAEWHNNLGVALARLGNVQEATASFRRAVELRPNYAVACNNLGCALRDQGHLDRAIEQFQRAVEIDPQYAEGFTSLATALREAGKIDEAIESAQRAVEIAPQAPEVHANLGIALAAARKTEQAIGCFRQGIRISPQDAKLHCNLGTALAEHGDLDEGVATLRRATELDASYPEALNNLGVALQDQGHTDEAIACYDRALELRSDYVDAHWNRALAWLLNGDFQRGWPEYEWRWKSKDVRRREYTQPKWDGSPLEGKTVLLYAEQGLGDTLQFIRFAALAESRGGRVVVECQAPLVPLLKRCPHVDALISDSESSPPPFDVHAPLMSLPAILGTSSEALPNSVPYLDPDPELVAHWREELSPFPGFKVGIVWQGNPRYRGDRYRSIALPFFAWLCEVEGVQLFSLQKGYGSEQLHAMADWLPVIDLGTRLDERHGPFMDTAAVMRNLDLVITSDTSIAHLAGGLGVPVWLALSFARDWRWMVTGDRSPWYPTMRLFRQQIPGDWLDVFQRIRGALEEYVQERTGQRNVRSRDAQFSNNLGAAFGRRGLHQAALVCFEQASRLASSVAGVHNNLALARAARGDVDGAVCELREALRLDPNYSEAAYHLGRAYLEQGKLAEAVPQLERAVHLKPSFVDAWYLLAMAHRKQDRMEQAIGCYERVLQLAPTHAAAHHDLGVARLKSGQVDQAIACFEQALAVQPEFAEAHHGLGTALARKECHEMAIEHYRIALRLRPDFAEVPLSMGHAFQSLGKAGQARGCFERALQLAPESAEAHHSLAGVLAGQGDLECAMRHYREAVRLKPDFAAAYINLGNALSEVGQFDAAAQSFREALRIQPDHAGTYNSLAGSFMDRGAFDDAARTYEQAIRIRPDFNEACSNLGVALARQGRIDEALHWFNEVIQRQPDNTEAHWNRAITLLLAGRFAEGWREYEWRLRRKEHETRCFDQPAWDGAVLDGRTIVLYAEQGLGDTLQFVRHAPLVKERGGRVVVECQRPLRRLLATCPGIDELVARGDPLPHFHTHAPLMSLPRLLKTTLDTIPAPVPYVFADPSRVALWQSRLQHINGFKIGIAWQGNPKYKGDRHRSIPLRCFAPLAGVRGVQLVSLQKGYGTEQLRELAGTFSLVDLESDTDNGPDAFIDTAAVMQCLDLVITSDTSIAHLAGALGVPVWVVLSAAPDWRYLLDRADSPWYPTMRLFRQDKLGDWSGVFDRVADALQTSIHTQVMSSKSRATSAVQPVWWLAPMPRPVSPWKYS